MTLLHGGGSSVDCWGQSFYRSDNCITPVADSVRSAVTIGLRPRWVDRYRPHARVCRQWLSTPARPAAAAAVREQRGRCGLDAASVDILLSSAHIRLESLHSLTYIATDVTSSAIVSSVPDSLYLRPLARVNWNWNKIETKHLFQLFVSDAGTCETKQK